MTVIMKKTFYIILAAALTLTSCMKDLDQRPVTDTESSEAEVYSTAEGFGSVLAKIYASYVIVGQEKGGGNADISSNNGQDFLRCWFNLQEDATDEVASTWLSGDKVADLTYMSWDSSDPWVSDAYYRLFYTIALCNEFLRHSGAASSFGDSDRAAVEAYCSEARFLRALAYWAVLDLFGQGPFVDETMPVGAYMPEAYDAAKLFDYIESELTAISLPSRTAAEYGRASEAAAWALLARLYLNAETYGAGNHYTDCITYCKKVREAGYSLESDWSKLFNADNHLRTNEIIFPFVVDADNTVTWGATTLIICGQCGNENNQNPADYGLDKGWGMFRVRGELPALFGDGDSRRRFYTDDSSQWFTGAIDDQSQGWFSEKWSNLTDTGAAASASAEDGVSTDWPFLRLADVYLMEAEAVLRGGSGTTRSEALNLVNELRRRAYGSTAGNISDSDFSLDFILDERGREMYHEAVRRTDLRRFGRFTTGAYLWQWKGGALDGRSVDDKYNIYPIPAPELSANTNLKNEKY